MVVGYLMCCVQFQFTDFEIRFVVFFSLKFLFLKEVFLDVYNKKSQAWEFPIVAETSDQYSEHV